MNARRTFSPQRLASTASRASSLASRSHDPASAIHGSLSRIRPRVPRSIAGRSFAPAVSRGERLAWLALGIAIGVIAEALLDPRLGRGRRTRLRDRSRALAHDVADDLRGAAIRLGDRARGLAHEVRMRRVEGDVPDGVLIERVRAQLGRPATHPGALCVAARDGCVVVSGPILAAEADAVLATVGRVRGVRDVVDRLERHEPAGGPPA